MSRRVLLRSLGRCCLGLVAVLVAGGAAEVLPVSLNFPLLFRRTHFEVGFPTTELLLWLVWGVLGGEGILG